MKPHLDCKTVGFFFLKISKEIGKACRKSLTRARRASLASFQTFCLTARAYLNTQKYGLFCSLNHIMFLRTTTNYCKPIITKLRKDPLNF